MRRGLYAALVLAAGTRGTTTPANAGGGPENVLLVVNASSESSKTIANHYIELRKIPAQNVVYLDWTGNKEAVPGKAFRSRILMPVLKAIEDRRLNAQIDYVVYSSDFPWRVDLQNLFPNEKLTPPFDAGASLTGATYLAPFVVSRNPAIVMPNVNWYVPGPVEQNQLICQQLGNVPSRGFRARYLWKKDGVRTTDAAAGQRYLLSTMLGVTFGRGNTVAEVLSYLRRAASADGKRPRGTIYFMHNQDPRSKPRHNCYPSVAEQIQRLGVRAMVQRGTIPRNAKDVLGLMTGVGGFDWAESGSVILPGAICEHLTSNGGVMRADASQTPLSEFLRHGAAGSSGTVKEPRAIQAKFPLPSLHLHYVRGCSLAEAFYQSVSGPYQLLIVGDPLCQPWALFPTVEMKAIKPGQEVSGPLLVTPSGTGGGGQTIGAFELFVDGRLAARSRPGQTIGLNTAKLPDGYHELRLVGANANAIETQGRSVVPIIVKNREAELEIKVSPLPVVGHGGKVSVSVRYPGANAIVIRQNSREVGRVQGEAGEVEIPAATLGRGPTTLQATSEGSASSVSRPVRLQVE
ncbi:MAG: hypothetical protein WD738_16045 [Pirellulales bacterium]